MQESKFMTILKRFVWLFPLIIVTIGIFYFMNLFERIYSRDLNRQIIEKNQLLTLTESLSSYQDVKHTILTLDTFTNIYTYMLYDEPDTLLPYSKAEIYHSSECPYLLKKHPYDLKEIRDRIINNKQGSFVTKKPNKDKIVWEFRHFKVDNKKLLVITGVKSYPKELVDKELEIAVGLMLLITAILNWALVGFWKHKCCGACEVKRRKKTNGRK